MKKLFSITNNKLSLFDKTVAGLLLVLLFFLLSIYIWQLYTITKAYPIINSKNVCNSVESCHKYPEICSNKED